MNKIFQVETISDGGEWNEIINTLPNAHILQTWQWGEFKSSYGWEKLSFAWKNSEGKIVAAAMILHRTMKMFIPGVQIRVFYVPRGPLLDWKDQTLSDQVLDDLKAIAKKYNAIFVKIDGEILSGKGEPDSDKWLPDTGGTTLRKKLIDTGWKYSKEQVQFSNTIWMDLSRPEKEILAGMKQKTRYNIRLAQKKGVHFRIGTPKDFEILYKIYAETSIRDGFVIREQDYYLRLWNKFFEEGMMVPLIAEVDNSPTAGLMLFIFSQRAWYLHGMSTATHREKMPGYLLQWEAIRIAKNAGCKIYDLWGAPTRFNQSDPLWGVYRYKEGFAGDFISTLGAWDFPINRLLYHAYHTVLPVFLEILRKVGRNKTRQEVSL